LNHKWQIKETVLNKFITAVSAAAILVGTSFSSSSFAFEQKVGIIDMNTIFKSLPQPEQINQNLQLEFKERSEKIQGLVKEMQELADKGKRDGAVMTQQERLKLRRKMESLKSIYQLDNKALEEDTRFRQGEENNKLMAKIQKAVEEVGKSGKYDIIMQAKAVAYFDKKQDISALIVKKVSKSK